MKIFRFFFLESALWIYGSLCTRRDNSRRQETFGSIQYVTSGLNEKADKDYAGEKKKNTKYIFSAMKIAGLSELSRNAPTRVENVALGVFRYLCSDDLRAVPTDIRILPPKLGTTKRCGRRVQQHDWMKTVLIYQTNLDLFSDDFT